MGILKEAFSQPVVEDDLLADIVLGDDLSESLEHEPSQDLLAFDFESREAWIDIPADVLAAVNIPADVLESLN